MTALKASIGCAPTSWRPLMKKVGVSLVPMCEFFCESVAMYVLNLFELSVVLNLLMLRLSLLV